MKVVSYYTPLYSEEAAGLIKSMEKLGFKDYTVEQRPQRGNWVQNTQVKAHYILEKLLENESVIWTDADSRMRQLPDLFRTIDSDVGLFYMKDPSFTLPSHSMLHSCDDVQLNGFLQTGTMFFRRNERTIALLERWISLNQADSSQWDQWTLQYACNQTSNLTVHRLPPECVWIDGISMAMFGPRKPVFEHLQASRRYKKMLG